MGNCEIYLGGYFFLQTSGCGFHTGVAITLVYVVKRSLQHMLMQTALKSESIYKKIKMATYAYTLAARTTSFQRCRNRKCVLLSTWSGIAGALNCLFLKLNVYKWKKEKKNMFAHLDHAHLRHTDAVLPEQRFRLAVAA